MISISLPHRIAISAAAVTVIGVLISISHVYVSSAEYSARLSEDIIDASVSTAAAEALAIIDEAQTLARTMSSSLEGLYISGNRDRAAFAAVVENSIRQNPGIVGGGLITPTDMLGADEDHRGARYSDDAGRLLPYFYHENGSVAWEPLVLEPGSGMEDWYDRPMDLRQLVLLDPYVYPVGGVDVLMTTASAPIVVDGQSIGVATVDLGLTDLVAALADIEAYDTGFAGLISQNGSWVAHRNADQLGEPLADTTLVSAFEAAVRGEMTSGETMSGGVAYRFAMAPVIYPNSGATWVAFVSVPMEEIAAGSDQLQMQMFLVGALIAVVSTVVLWFIGKGIARPVLALAKATQQIAEDQSAVTVTGTDRRDEIGNMARAVQVLKDGSERRRELETEASASAERAKAERETLMTRIATDLDSSISGSAEQARGSVDTALSTARTLSQTAANSAEQSRDVADATSEAGQAITAASSSIEEITASVQEIARQANQAALVTSRASTSAEGATEMMAKLEDAAQRIGDVVSLIKDVADRTNLLALNATIEAARAGEAGKGFAVVASEVKALAVQTSKATEEITNHISGIQETATAAAVSIDEISGSIDSINETSQMIASAVEEQQMATSEISAQITAIANQATRAGSTADRLADLAGVTGQESGGMVSTMSTLHDELKSLVNVVEDAISRIRAA